MRIGFYGEKKWTTFRVSTAVVEADDTRCTPKSQLSPYQQLYVNVKNSDRILRQRRFPIIKRPASN